MEAYLDLTSTPAGCIYPAHTVAAEKRLDSECALYCEEQEAQWCFFNYKIQEVNSFDEINELIEEAVFAFPVQEASDDPRYVSYVKELKERTIEMLYRKGWELY